MNIFYLQIIVLIGEGGSKLPGMANETQRLFLRKYESDSEFYFLLVRDRALNKKLNIFTDTLL